MSQPLQCFLIAGCKGNGATQPAENAPAQAVGSSDIAFVQVEAVLAQSDLFQSEGAALQEKTKKAQEGWAKKGARSAIEGCTVAGEVSERIDYYGQRAIRTGEDPAADRQLSVRCPEGRRRRSTRRTYVFTNRAQDLIHRAVQELNADKKYKLIPQRHVARRRRLAARHHAAGAGQGQRVVRCRQEGR